MDLIEKYRLAPVTFNSRGEKLKIRPQLKADEASEASGSTLKTECYRDY